MSDILLCFYDSALKIIGTSLEYNFVNARFAVVTCLAALATGTLSLHLMKKKREWVACKRDNLDIVPSDVIYNYPVLGHSLGFPKDPVARLESIGKIFTWHRQEHPDKAFAVIMLGPWQMVLPMREFYFYFIVS